MNYDEELAELRRNRMAGLLSEEDWAELAHMWVLDVVIAPTEGRDEWTAVVVFVQGPKAFFWSLAARSSSEEAVAAVRFLLRGLAGLRRLVGEKYPWAGGGGSDDPGRAQALDKVYKAWDARMLPLWLAWQGASAAAAAPTSYDE